MPDTLTALRYCTCLELLSFATLNHANGLWLTTQARQTDCPKVNISFSCPSEDVKYFEITSILTSWLRDVQVWVELVAAVEMKDDLGCNHQYVRHVLKSLIFGGILGKTQVSDVLLELDISSQLQGLRIQQCQLQGLMVVLVTRFKCLFMVVCSIMNLDPSINSIATSNKELHTLALEQSKVSCFIHSTLHRGEPLFIPRATRLAIGNSFFASRNLWSVVVQRPYHWLMQQGLLIDGDPYRRITGDQVTIEHPDRQLLYFEVASFKRDRLDDVSHIIRSTDPEDADDTLKCNRKWVRNILRKLVAGRILSRNKAGKILLEPEMSCTEIQFHLQRF
ncbi:unnamed protein product [Fusarium fujikuroi]|nr:unnamed protein product [Fusarium fujikuroi]